MSIRARAWIGLLLPAIGWFVFQQGLSAMLHADCTRSGLGLLWGVLSLILCALGPWLTRSLRRHEGALANPWLARLGLAVAAIFALAIAFQTLALLIVPACLA